MSESPFSNPKVKGKIGLGLYAGVRVEVSLWGYTGALEATITVEASGELVYNFGTNEGAFWHNGVGVIVTVLAEANLQKESNKCNRGSVSAKAGKEYRVKWCDAGSENNPLIHLAF